MTEQEFINYTKQVLSESKEELSTVKIQILSLVRFMRAVGYEPVDTENPRRFKLATEIKGFPLDINLENAVKLHNYGFFVKHYGKHFEFPVSYKQYLATNVHLLRSASEQKVVHDVYLQWSKKRKEFTVTSNIVKFKD